MTSSDGNSKFDSVTCVHVSTCVLLQIGGWPWPLTQRIQGLSSGYTPSLRWVSMRDQKVVHHPQSGCSQVGLIFIILCFSFIPSKFENYKKLHIWYYNFRFWYSVICLCLLRSSIELEWPINNQVKNILGSENFTRWLVWGDEQVWWHEKDVLLSLPLLNAKGETHLITVGRVQVPPQSLNVTNIQPTFLEWESTIHSLPLSQNLGLKKNWVDVTSHQKKSGQPWYIMIYHSSICKPSWFVT